MTLKYKENISFADAWKCGPETSDLQPIFKPMFNFFKYILNYCLLRLDVIVREQIPVNYTAATDDPVENTPTINTDDTTVLNNNTAASNDENNVDMACVATSAIAMKRSVDDDSSDEETRPNAIKMSAASSPASIRTDTYVSKDREEWDLPKISTFPSAPKSGEQRANMRSLLHIRPPSFSSGVSSRVGTNINHEKPPPPQKKKKVMWKHHILKNHKYGSQLHNPVELQRYWK